MDLSAVKIAGAQRVTYLGLDLGHTLDGVTLSVDRTFADVNVDRYGSMPVDKILTGSRLYVKFKLAQSDWRQWEAAQPETSSFDGASQDRIDFGADAGVSLRAAAGLLNIHPLARVLSDQTDDIVIYRAVSVDNIEVPITIDGQRVIEVTLEGLVDESFGAGRRLGHIGYAAVS